MSIHRAGKVIKHMPDNGLVIPTFTSEELPEKCKVWKATVFSAHTRPNAKFDQCIYVFSESAFDAYELLFAKTSGWDKKSGVQNLVLVTDQVERREIAAKIAKDGRLIDRVVASGFYLGR